jgi:hypothetical protein
MFSTRKLGLFFFLVGVSASLGLSAWSLTGPMTDATLFPAQPIVLSSLKGEEWTSKCIELHPELLWLDRNLKMENEKYEQTLLSIHCLEWILDGSDEAYEQFTAAQPEDERLTRESFQELSQQGHSLLQSKWSPSIFSFSITDTQIARVMEATLVLKNTFKSEKGRTVFSLTTRGNHDESYKQAMQVLRRWPTLSYSYLHVGVGFGGQLIQKVVNLANYGHITHLEGGPELFTRLKKSEIPYSDPTALSFDLFVHTCRVAGSLGHIDNQSSLAYTERAHRALKAMATAVNVLADPTKTEELAYNTYLQTRASWLGFDPEDHIDRVLTRVGTMLRLFTPEEGEIVKLAFMQLDAATRKEIVRQLDVQSNTQLTCRYAHVADVLLNLSNNPALGDTKEGRLTNAVIVGLPFIAGGLERHRQLMWNHNVTEGFLTFDQIALRAKTDLHLQKVSDYNLMPTQ